MNEVQDQVKDYQTVLYGMEQDFFAEDGPTSERLEIVSMLIMETAVEMVPVQRQATE